MSKSRGLGDLTPIQVTQGKIALYQFCIASYLLQCTFTIPVIVGPTVMQGLGMHTSSHIVLAAPLLAVVPFIPFLDRYILCVGLESAILQTNMGYTVSMAILAFAFNTTNTDLFVCLLVIGMFIQGLCVIAGLTAD